MRICVKHCLNSSKIQFFQNLYVLINLQGKNTRLCMHCCQEISASKNDYKLSQKKFFSSFWCSITCAQKRHLWKKKYFSFIQFFWPLCSVSYIRSSYDIVGRLLVSMSEHWSKFRSSFFDFESQFFIITSLQCPKIEKNVCLASELHIMYSSIFLRRTKHHQLLVAMFWD